MNLQDRVRKYTERGFQVVEGEILVLIEESAAAIFESFLYHVILYGGAALALFYESPRLSRDLDLLTSPVRLPSPEEIQAVVRSSIQPIAKPLASADSSSATTPQVPTSQSIGSSPIGRLSSALISPELAEVS